MEDKIRYVACQCSVVSVKEKRRVNPYWDRGQEGYYRRTSSDISSVGKSYKSLITHTSVVELQLQLALVLLQLA